MILYKYLKPEHGLTTLKTRRIKVTKPSEFNDVLEYLPRPTPAPPEEEARRQLVEWACSREKFVETCRLGYKGSYRSWKAKVLAEDSFENCLKELLEGHDGELLTNSISQ